MLMRLAEFEPFQNAIGRKKICIFIFRYPNKMERQNAAHTKFEEGFIASILGTLVCLPLAEGRKQGNGCRRMHQRHLQ